MKKGSLPFHFLTVFFLLIHSVSVSFGDDNVTQITTFIAKNGLCCEMCPKGRHWIEDCTAEGKTACDLLTLPPSTCIPECNGTISQNVRCAPCPDGTFMETWNNATECKKHTPGCPDDSMILVSQGDAESDIVCHCPEQYTGYYNHLLDPPVMHCELWISCPPGEEPENEPTTFSNTVCRACPSGTYSAEDSLEPCVPCKNGTFADSEGSTTCIHHSGCEPDEYIEEAGDELHDTRCNKMTEPGGILDGDDETTPTVVTEAFNATVGAIGTKSSEVSTILLGLILGIGIPLLFFLILIIICKQCKKRSERRGKNDEEAKPMTGKPEKNSEPHSKSKGDSDGKPTVHDLLAEYEDDDTLSDKYKDLPFIDEDIASQVSQRSRRQINPRI